MKIVLDRERNLRMTLNAMIRFEEETGKEFTKLDTKSMTLKDIRFFLWLCLAWEDPELTEEQVGTMISAENLSDILDAMNTVKSNPTPGPA